MAIDPRREAGHVAREFTRYQNTVGEAVLWYVFDTTNSQYDSVYDEGYRRYELPLRVPVLWTDQQEAAEDYSPEGRRPSQRLRFAVGARQLFEQGISVTEAHGNRISDTQVSPVWKDDRLNDIIFYDGRFYEISNFQIRGRLQGEDVVIGVSCIETKPADELNLDNVPDAWFPVPPLNPTTPTTPEVVLGPTAPTNPQVGDIWLDTQ
jgi:hypothetical protein